MLFRHYFPINKSIEFNNIYKHYDYFKIDNFQIDQPIMIGDIENIILNTRGVMSIASIKFLNRHEIFENRIYSPETYSPNRNIDRGMLFPTRGGIFEFRHLNDDIIGRIN